MSKFRITYYAEGHRNGCKVTLHDVCGLVYDDFIIDLKEVGNRESRTAR